MANFIPSPLEAPHDFVLYKDVRIPMSDGAELSADISFPSVNGVADLGKAYPVILSRSPYRDLGMAVAPPHWAYFCAERGYVYVYCSVRGTGRSDGVFEPMANEGWGASCDGYGGRTDGIDTLNWILAQPWCDGHVATTGKSYLGGTQYLLHLSCDAPELVTCVIDSPAVNSFGGSWVYQQDFLDTACALWWPFQMAMPPRHLDLLPQAAQEGIQQDLEAMSDEAEDADVEAFYAGLRARHSLRDIPVVRHLDYYQRWLDNRDNPAFFAYNDVLSRPHATERPLLFHTGWFDLFSMNALEGFRQTVRQAPTEQAAQSHRLVVGAWGHTPNPQVRRFPESETDDRLMSMDWIEQQLRGQESPYFRDNPVSLFVMGENRWRGEQEWPLSDEQRTRLYLHSEGSANTLAGDGTLSAQAPEQAEPADRYAYDPADPVSFPGGIGVTCGGQCDQREAEQRQDVLTYTGEVLEEDVEVTGYVTARLYAATSAEDTDFFMRLLDVCPDGTVWNVVAGGRRGRYVREGRTRPVPLVPGEVYAYDVSLRATSYVFKAGHRIRVDVTSSDTLHADVNPNAYLDLNSCTAADYVVAEQRVLHDAEHASYVELPVIPASHERRWIDEWPFSARITGVESIWASFEPESRPVRRCKGSELS